MSGHPTIREGLVPLAGACLMLAVALAHLGTIDARFEAASYLGVATLLGITASVASACGILGGRRWGWATGAAVAGASLLAYPLSWAAGADAGGPGRLLEPAAVLAGTLESLFLVLCAWELFPARIGGRSLALGAAAVLAVAGLATALILAGFGPTHDGADGTADTPGHFGGSRGPTQGDESWRGAARG